MGQSTDAILCFGVDLGEGVDDDYENILPWKEEEYDNDFEEWLHDICGVSDAHLWREYSDWIESKPDLQGYAISYQERMAAFENVNPGWIAERERLREKQQVVERECPIELVRHCSGDYPMYIVAVKGTVTKAYRGSPTMISHLFVDASARVKADRFCAEYGIPFDSPEWLLASMWWT